MAKKLFVYSAIFALVVSNLMVFWPAQKAAAWAPATHLPTCTSLGADFNWDWQSSLQSFMGSNWTTSRPGVNIATDTQDSIIGFIPRYDTGHIYITFGKQQGHSYLYTDNTGTYISAAHPDSWSSSTTYSISKTSHSGWVGVGTMFENYDVNRATPVTGSTSDLLCIEFAKGVIQGIWGYNVNSGGTYSNSLPGVPRSCDGFLQIACTVEDIFSGIADSFSAVGQAVLRGLGALFVPDGNQLNSDWSGFYATLTTKLGFLTWPFSFIGDMFTAITTPTTTCCVIGAGMFMGATFPGIDLAFASTHLPSLWNFATAAIRGLTVLMLLFMLRSKFMEITSR